jgi:hypothetical protein
MQMTETSDAEAQRAQWIQKEALALDHSLWARRRHYLLATWGQMSRLDLMAVYFEIKKCKPNEKPLPSQVTRDSMISLLLGLWEEASPRPKGM